MVQISTFIQSGWADRLLVSHHNRSGPLSCAVAAIRAPDFTYTARGRLDFRQGVAIGFDHVIEKDDGVANRAFEPWPVDVHSAGKEREVDRAQSARKIISNFSN